jgi:Flp pilus assembly protein TadG
MFRSAKSGKGSPRKTGASSRLVGDKRGATAVELALVFPLFIMIVLGIIEIGQALRLWNEVQHALGRAVRLVNVNASTTPSEITSAMRSYLTDVDADSLTVTATPVTISGITHIKISVGFPFEIILPFTDISTVTINVDRTAPVLSATN